MADPNKYLLSRLAATRKALIASYEGGSTLPNAVKGSERETFVQSYLEKIFPPPYRFGSGAITDMAGNCSGQIDVVIEYPLLPSFPMPNGNERLYLAESVAVAIEVKSDLSSQWNEVENTARQLSPLLRRWEGSVRMVGGGIQMGATNHTKIPLIAVGFRGPKTIDTLKRKLAETPEDRRPSWAMVINSGLFAGVGGEAWGDLSLLGLSIAIMGYITEISSANINLRGYVV